MFKSYSNFIHWSLMFLVVYTEAVFTSIHYGIDITTPQNLYVKLLMLLPFNNSILWLSF